MKNLSLVINILLAGAVVFLFYKTYSPQKKAEPVLTPAPTGPASIVFINSDTLLDNYILFTNFKNRFEKKHDSIQNILDSRMKALEAEAKNYVEKEGAVMNEQQRMEKEESLKNKQQQLVDLRESMLDRLGKEQDAMNDSIHDNLIHYLREFNRDKNYTYILGYQKGGGILLANDSLDITKQVLSGLNDQFEKK